MSMIKFRGKQPTWIAGFALSLIAAATLSACGGGGGGGGGGTGGGDGGGGGDVGTADLTAAGTKAQVGTLGTLIDALDTFRDLNDVGGIGFEPTTKPFAKTSRVRAKALEDCSAGGSIEETGPTSKNVNSPFTDEAMSVQGTLAKQCKFAETYTDNDATVDIAITINGSTEGGSLDRNNKYVEYFRIGDDNGPYSLSYDVKSSGSAQGTSFSSETALDIKIRYRDDYTESSSGSENRFVMSYNGDYDTTASSGGHSGSTSGTFTSYIGKDGAPFTSTEDNTGAAISGEYGFKLTGPQGAACPSGGVKITTLDPLMDSNGGAMSSPFSSGRLQFASGDNRSEVRFNNDGTVTVTGSDGQTDTFDFGAAVAAAAPCAGYALGGLFLSAAMVGN